MNLQADANGTRYVPGLRISGAKAECLGPKRSRQVGLAWLSLALVLVLVFTSGCNRNKNRQIQPQAAAPVISVPPTAQPSPAPPVQTTPPPATSAETGVIPQPSNSQPSAKPQPQRNSRKTTPATPKQPPPPAQATTVQPAPPAPQKPPATSGEGQVQIASQVPQGTAQNTEQLLQTAESKLRKVTRQLSDGEQAMLRQVHNYIAQSRSATQDGDLERAYNLAMKANLLSSELAK